MKKILFYTVVLVLLYSCAQQVAPVGGAKDITPPIVVESIPENYSVNFTENKIKITFNEFIQLNNMQEEFLSSPMMEHPVENTLRGKTLILEIQDTITEKTTFTFSFGNAIGDFTENNILKYYEYVFATGEKLDSLSIKGRVIDALTLEPPDKAMVMLYDTIYDSVPCKEKPKYLAKTDKNGNFVINNLPDKKYKIFALQDANRNYMYDLPNEKIAFLDSLVQPEYIPRPVLAPVDTAMIDSTLTDSLNIQADSLAPSNTGVLDSLTKDSIPGYQTYNLLMFEEDDSTQKLLKSSSIGDYKLTFYFKQPVHNPIITPIDTAFTVKWYVKDPNPTKDTITYWLMNTQTTDSLILQVSDDTLVLDTVDFKLDHPPPPDTVSDEQEKKKKKPTKAKKGRASTNTLQVNYNVSNNGSIEFYRPLKVSFSIPPDSMDVSSFLFYEDTIPITFTPIFQDSLHKSFKIGYKWKEEKKYTFIVPDSSVIALNGFACDSSAVAFRSSSPGDYASLFINAKLKDTAYNYIFQLMQESVVVRQKQVSSNQQVAFPHLKPGDYQLKAIEDRNHNEKWDTGDYMENIQPEHVIIFNKNISIKAGWDLEESWNMKEKENKIKDSY